MAAARTQRHQVRVMFTEAEFRTYRAIAASEGCSLPSLVRRLLRMKVFRTMGIHVDQQGDPATPQRAATPKPKGTTR